VPVQLIDDYAMNLVVSHIDGVRESVSKEAEVIEGRAKGYLEEARATTHWHNIGDPASTGHRAEVTLTHGDVDSFVNLEGPDAIAIEFGHEPSGVFGPGGSLGHLVTRAPHGLYILTHATGFTDLSS